jgi:predicted RNase H-like HicB family nuclease
MDNNNKQIYNYTVILQKEPEVGYHAFCPILKGCHSQGDSFEEAIDNITEAIELYIESLKAVLIVILSLRKISLYSN